MPSKIREDHYLPEGGRINASGFWESDTHRQCSRCRCVFKKSSKMTLCHTCNTKRVVDNSPEWKMWQRAKQRAKRLNREFDLEVKDVTIPDVCPILGIRLVVHKGKSGAFADSPSLDRVDNSRGYTKDNVRVISQRANQMKGDASAEELVVFAEYILSTYKQGANK